MLGALGFLQEDGNAIETTRGNRIYPLPGFDRRHCDEWRSYGTLYCSDEDTTPNLTMVNDGYSHVMTRAGGAEQVVRLQQDHRGRREAYAAVRSRLHGHQEPRKLVLHEQLPAGDAVVTIIVIVVTAAVGYFDASARCCVTLAVS